MMLSMTLLSTISKTKKRLSDDSWYLPCMTLMIIGLLATSAWAFRSLYLTWDFGLIRAKIPVMYQPLSDPATKDLGLVNEGEISRHTPVVVLTNQSMFIGDLESFTQSFTQVRNKIEIAHLNGSPQVGELIKALKQWTRSREIRLKIKPSPFAVLIPGEQWPVAVIMQIIRHLKNSGLYEHIILGADIY